MSQQHSPVIASQAPWALTSNDALLSPPPPPVVTSGRPSDAAVVAPAQRALVQTFLDPNTEQAYRCFVFSGRLISGVIATMVSSVYVYVLILYGDGMPAWVTALNAIGIIVSVPTGIAMILSATVYRRMLQPSEARGDHEPPDGTAPRVVESDAVPAPEASALKLAAHEEYGLTILLTTAMWIQAATIYAKYAGCVAKYGPVDCIDYVDIYLIALLETFCVIAPARFVLVLPCCLAALAIFAISYAWTDVPGVDGTVHGTRVAVEVAVSLVNFMSCWFREAGIRRAFVRKIASDAETRKVAAMSHNIRELTTKMLPESQLKRLLTSSSAEKTTNGDSSGDDGAPATGSSPQGIPRHFDQSRLCSVYRSDLAGFTAWSTTITSEEMVETLSALTAHFDQAARDTGVEKVKTIGDAYWAVCGLPDANLECVSRIAKFAVRTMESAERIFANLTAQQRTRPGGMRIGLGTGTGYGTIVGQQQISYEIFGEANDIACLMEPAGAPGMILVCERTRDRLEITESNLFVFSRPLSEAVRVSSTLEVRASFLAPRGSLAAAELVRLDAREDQDGIGHVSSRSSQSSFALSPHTSGNASPTSTDLDEDSPSRSRRDSAVGPFRQPSLLTTRAVQQRGTMGDSQSQMSAQSKSVRSSGYGLAAANSAGAAVFALDNVSDTENTAVFNARVGYLADLMAHVNNDRGVGKSLYMVFRQDDELEHRFVDNGIRIEQMPFRACAIALTLSVLTLAVYVTASGLGDGGVAGIGSPVMLFASFAVSLVFPVVLIVAPPTRVVHVLVLLGLYYLCGAFGILGAGLAEPSYLTKNVFYLRMAFAVLKGSVVSIPALYGMFHDFLGPTVAVAITLFVRDDSGAPSERVAWFRGEYVVWLVASFLVGVLCRIANETSNRRNFLVGEIASTVSAELQRQTEKGTGIVARVIPAKVSRDVLDWFGAVMQYRARREAAYRALLASPLKPEGAATSIEVLENASFSYSVAEPNTPMVPTTAAPMKPPPNFMINVPHALVMFVQLKHKQKSVGAHAPYAQGSNSRLHHTTSTGTLPAPSLYSGNVESDAESEIIEQAAVSPIDVRDTARCCARLTRSTRSSPKLASAATS
jgi:class 3 adenylate cyclase